MNRRATPGLPPHVVCDNCGDDRTARCRRCDARVCTACDRCVLCRTTLCRPCTGATVTPHHCEGRLP
jgi:hypothetical protein